MKLSRIFQSKANAFLETVATDDLPRMEKLMQKKSIDFVLEFIKADYMKDLTPRMAALLVEKMDAGVIERWHMDGSGRQSILDLMLSSAMGKNRQEVTEVLLEKTGTDFNEKNGGWYLQRAISSSFPDDVKLRYMKKILAGGHNRMEDTDQAVTAAVEKNFIAGIDLFAVIGFDMHKNNEQYLRAAAKYKSEATALHLVTRYAADIDLAISTEMALGNAPVFEFLTDLKKQLPEKTAPRTVETLTAEVGSLQDTVRELTEKLAKLQPDSSLNKPVLRSPSA